MANRVDASGTGESRVNPNVNCLYGKRCPKCGSYGPFEVEVFMRVLLSDDGSSDAEDGTIDYSDDSAAVCFDCKYEGKVGDFNVP